MVLKEATMSRLDTISPNLSFSPVSLSESTTDHRLIVLIPDAETDYATAIHRVWELANAFGSRVQFLGLCKDAVEEPSLRRQLVTLSALAQGGKVSAEVRIEFGTDWVKVIKADLKDGDTVVCFSEQHVGLARKPLSQILESNLGTPVYVLSGLLAQEQTASNWPKQTFAWAGSIGIILGFFWLQTQIHQAASDWAYTTLLLLSLFLEAALLLFWNSLFG
jgi:hypothetical protein